MPWSALRWVADLLLPRFCPGCGRGTAPAAPDAFCPACAADLPRLVEPWCDRCGEPGVTGRCRRCHDAPPPFAVARAAFRFAGPVREAIHALKFRGGRGAGAVLGAAMASALRHRVEVVTAAALVASVPLHVARVRERGWDQAALIGRTAARCWDLPYVADALVRARPTPPQVGLDRPARIANMAAAFGAGPASASANGRTVILVDDVLTTGATAGAAAAALLAAGAAEVRVAAVARD